MGGRVDASSQPVCIATTHVCAEAPWGARGAQSSPLTSAQAGLQDPGGASEVSPAPTTWPSVALCAGSSG